jgi:glycosyltransferase involved in cell wall biosynthesis
MRLGFDVRPFLREETGVGTYLRNLLFELAEIDRTNEYYLFSSSWKDRFPKDKIPPFERRKFRDFRLPVRLLNWLWQRRRRPPLDSFFGTQLDLAHSATPLILPTRGRKVITVHDIFFLDFPDRSGDEAGKVFYRLAAASFRDADGIITSSQFTSVELASRFALDEKKVRIIPPGLDGLFLEDVSDDELRATRERLNLPPSFLLFVGAQVPRKNLVRFIEALKIVHLRGIRIPLVLVGPRGEDSSDIRKKADELGIGAWVMPAGYLEARDIRNAYRLASASSCPLLGRVRDAACRGHGQRSSGSRFPGLAVPRSDDAAVYFDPKP